MGLSITSRMFITLALAGLLLMTAGRGLAFSDETGKEAVKDEGQKTVLTLDDAIKMALRENAEIKGAEFEAEVMKGKKEQADAARFVQVELTAYGSLSPRARLKEGLVESSTNINKPSYDGVFGRADVQLIQPLYTFGKISAYREAAEHGIKVYEAGARLKATEVALMVKEAYFGLLLGRELKWLLEDIKEQLDKATDKVQRQLDAGAPGVDQVDLLKLRTYQGELEKYRALADEGIEKAYFGLKVLTGLEAKGQELETADQYLVPAEVDIDKFETYRDMAMKGRLEFVQLREGLFAREALVTAERADYYPQVFLAALYSIAGATNRDHLNNPYITDEFNHAYGGAVLGFKWTFDLGIKKGRVSEARAEYMKLKMKEEYALDGVPFQVKEAYLQLVRSEDEMKATSNAYRSAKQWVVASLANFDLGVGEARDIADSVSAYARLRADYFRAIFNQRMAIANLEHATGRDAEYLPYEARRGQEN
jgi:outer membrane protein